MAIGINTTLNSQIEYWKGQKRFVLFKKLALQLIRRKGGNILPVCISPTGEEYPIFRAFTLRKIRPYSSLAFWKFYTRNGKGMNPSIRPKKGKDSKWGWGLFRRQNSPPNCCTSLYERKRKFYKQQSLKVIKRGFLKWIIQTNCIHYATR